MFFRASYLLTIPPPSLGQASYLVLAKYLAGGAADTYYPGINKIIFHFLGASSQISVEADGLDHATPKTDTVIRLIAFLSMSMYCP